MILPAPKSIWAIVPAKTFTRAKSRLGSALDASARAVLAARMLSHVLDTARTCAQLRSTLVITDGEDVAALAQRLGANVARDPAAAASLADVVDSAIAHASRSGADAVLVLMGDLPCVDAADLEAMLDGLRSADVVLAPDRAGARTNALAVRGATRFTTCFGDTRSLAAHVARAEALGLRSMRIERPGLALDVDDPADLAACATELGVSSAPAPKSA